MFGCDLGIVGFFLVGWVRTGAPGCRRFIGARRVHSDSNPTFRRGVGIVGFIRARPWGPRVLSDSLGSFGRALTVVAFIRAHAGGRLVYSDSLDSLGRALGAVRFFRVGWVRSRVP